MRRSKPVPRPNGVRSSYQLTHRDPERIAAADVAEIAVPDGFVIHEVTGVLKAVWR